MNKTTIWITAGAVAAALVVSGAGIAIADASDGGPPSASTLRDAGAEVVADVWDDTDDDANETDRDDTDSDSNETDTDDRDDTDNDVNETDTDRDDVDQPISSSDRARAEKAALAKAGGGRVTEVEHSDDGAELWEVDVTLDDGSEAEIELDANFTPTRIDADA